jgi:signal transduction histidine kinase/CheY-like chemotaxis protein
VFFSLLGLLGMYANHLLIDSFQKVVAKDAPAMLVLGNIKASFSRAMGETLGIALLRDMLAAPPEMEAGASNQLIAAEIQAASKSLGIALKQLDVFIKQYTSLSSSLVLEDNANFLYRLRSAADLFRKKASAWAIQEHGADTKDVFQFKQELGESEREFLELINNMIAIENLALQNSHQAANARAVSVAIMELILGFCFIVFSILIGRAAVKNLTGPLQNLNSAARALGAGNLQARVAAASADEVGQLARVFNQMAEQLATVYRQLERARDSAESANRAKSTFLANMSHEFRTPLNGILGYAQILQHDPSMTEKQLQGVQVIYNSGEYLLTLVNDILDLSKIEAGQFELRPQEFHLLSFLEEIADIFKIRAFQKNISFASDLPDNLPSGVLADPKRLRQVLINLLGNAIKYTGKGGVRFSVQYQPPRQFCFEIKDTGVGIAAEDLKKLFTPFQQVGDALHKAEGTGLGLSISKTLTELMGGRVRVESAPGQGSTFYLELPLQEVQGLQPPGRAQQRRVTGYRLKQALPGGRSRCRVLVAEDKPENRGVLKEMLLPLEFELIFAEDGAEAVELAKTSPPDLILMDLVMPRLDGFEATRQIRRLIGLNTVPIIAISASIFQQDRENSQDAGCNAFIAKPFRLEQLLACLQQYLPLEWIQTEISEETEDTSLAALKDSTVKLPPAHAEVLKHMAMQGNISGLLQCADQMEQDDPSLRGLALQVRRLARQFDDEAVLELVRRFS